MDSNIWDRFCEYEPEACKYILPEVKGSWNDQINLVFNSDNIILNIHFSAISRDEIDCKFELYKNNIMIYESKLESLDGLIYKICCILDEYFLKPL
jgi:hypothetical protein